MDPEFVEKFSSSIYVDDLVSGSHDVPSAHNFYLKSKLRLGTAGFKLRKFTNSAELQGLIEEEENPAVNEGVQANAEEEQSYAKASLGVKTVEGPGVTKVLGVQWNVP